MRPVHVLVLVLLGQAVAAVPQILAPPGDTVVGTGSKFTLRGEARSGLHRNDIVGKRTTSSLLTWTSSIQGILGHGSVLEVSLAPGLHVVTLSETDTGAYSSSSSSNNDNNLDNSSSVFVFVSLPDSSWEEYLEAWAKVEEAFLEGIAPENRTGSLDWYVKQVPKDVLLALDSDLTKFPTRVNGAVGNGGVAAGISKMGRVTVLRDDPAGFDHLDLFEYIDSVLPNMGAYFGLRPLAVSRERHAGDDQTVWFNLDDSKETSLISQTYLTPEDDLLVTVLEVNMTRLSPDLGIVRVQIEDYVPPGVNALVRNVTLLQSHKPLELISYENLAPCTLRVPELPVVDWLFDWLNDFGALYSAKHDAVVHFRPNHFTAAQLEMLIDLAHRICNTSTAGYPGSHVCTPMGTVGAKWSTGTIILDEFISKLDEHFPGGGAYWSIGSNIAAERTDIFSVVGPRPSPAIASASGNRLFHFGRTVSARAFQLAPHGSVSVIMANAKTAADSLTQLALAQSHLHALRSRTLDFWRAFSASTALPPTASKQVRDVLLRGMITVRLSASLPIVSSLSMDGAPTAPSFARAAASSVVHMARESNISNVAFAASIDTAPPYGSDWPRDSTFIQEALVESGHLDLAVQHALFLARMQRLSGPFPGSWGMNFKSDGTVAGPIPFEIDETGLALYAMSRLWFAIPDVSVRQQYLRDVWPAIVRAADLLVWFRDPFNGLPLPANEDDHPLPTQGIQGSTAVYAGLTWATKVGSAARMATSVQLSAWSDRAAVLKQAILKIFYNPEEQSWGLDARSDSMRGAIWFLYPAEIVPLDSADALKQVNAIRNHSGHSLFGDSPAGTYGYIAERMVALAHVRNAQVEAGHDVSDLTAFLNRVLEVLTTAVPSVGTNHYGEFYKASKLACTGVPKDSPRRLGPQHDVCVSPVNDVPHCYEHSLTYLFANTLLAQNASTSS